MDTHRLEPGAKARFRGKILRRGRRPPVFYLSDITSAEGKAAARPAMLPLPGWKPKNAKVQVAEFEATVSAVAGSHIEFDVTTVEIVRQRGWNARRPRDA